MCSLLENCMLFRCVKWKKKGLRRIEEKLGGYDGCVKWGWKGGRVG